MKATINTPCIGLCQMDEAGVHCLGCHRTLPEITQWIHYIDFQREEILRQLLLRSPPRTDH